RSRRVHRPLPSLRGRHRSFLDDPVPLGVPATPHGALRPFGLYGPRRAPPGHPGADRRRLPFCAAAVLPREDLSRAFRSGSSTHADPVGRASHGDLPRPHPPRAKETRNPGWMNTVAAFRLYFKLVSASLRAQMQYKVDFLVSLSFQAALQAVDFALLAAIMLRFPEIAGWNIYEVGLLYGTASIALSLYRTIAP